MNSKTLLSCMISSQLGIVKHLSENPMMSFDPKLFQYSSDNANLKYLINHPNVNLNNYQIKSGGCGINRTEAIYRCLGEIAERYSAAFYEPKEIIKSSYQSLNYEKIPIEEYALFHEKQYINPLFLLKRWTENIEISWTPTIDLTTGKTIYCPAQSVYIPFKDKNQLDFGTSTGVSSHSNFYQAILNSLYESIERDSFVLTWMQNIVPPKIIIDSEIKKYLDKYVSDINIEWNFFDMTYDIQIPTILGICFGQAEFGDFFTIASATRSSFGDALEKTIQELMQALPFLRHVLKETKYPNNYNELYDFEDHAIFYLRKKELWHIFDKYRHAPEEKKINFNERFYGDNISEVKRIISILSNKKYNVLFKDLTTIDINEVGLHVIRIFIPQLLRLGGMYPYYYLGGKRLYEVPLICGYQANDYDFLNPYPHPFP